MGRGPSRIPALLLRAQRNHVREHGAPATVAVLAAAIGRCPAHCRTIARSMAASGMWHQRPGSSLYWPEEEDK